MKNRQLEIEISDAFTKNFAYVEHQKQEKSCLVMEELVKQSILNLLEWQQLLVNLLVVGSKLLSKVFKDKRKFSDLYQRL